jgi:hypothetical protein
MPNTFELAARQRWFQIINSVNINNFDCSISGKFFKREVDDRFGLPLRP